MTDHTITATDFYTCLPTDVLVRIRTSHISSLNIMNDILSERGLVIDERGRGFYLTSEEDELFVGDTVDEAIDFIASISE